MKKLLFLLLFTSGLFSLASFANDSDDINQALTLTMNASYATCDISPDGTATVTVGGGVHPMTYQWSDGQTFVVAYNLIPGDYSVTVTDANGLTGVGDVTVITGTETIWLMPSSTDANCECNGTANPHAMLGIPPYSYAWSDGQTSEVATGLCPGTYTVTVTDQSGCANSAEVTIGGYGKLELDISSKNASCGKINGSATATPTSGIAPYNFRWNNGQKTSTITDLGPGQYTVTVTDAVGCSNTASTTVENEDNLSVSISPADGSVCKGDKLLFTAITKNTDVTYSWTATGGNFDDATIKTPNYMMNTPGVYTISVTIDKGGCSATASTTVTVEDRPDISMTPCAKTSCIGEDIAMSVNPDATTPGLTYLWTATGGTFSHPNGPATYYQNTVPGVYTIILYGIDPSGGCPAIDSMTITVLNFYANLTIDTPLSECGATDAKISVSTVGGQGEYSYEWSNGVVNQDYIDDISAGTYSVTVTDHISRCKTIAIITVEEAGIHIGNFVFYDSNEDCMQNAGETGIGMVPVHLISVGNDGIAYTGDDWVYETTYTDKWGYYYFYCVPFGTFYINFQALALHPDYEYTCQYGSYYDTNDSDANVNTGNTDPFEVVLGENDYSYDAGIHLICEPLQKGGEICCSQDICAGEIPDLLTSVVPATGMSAKPVEYLWMINLKPGPYDVDKWKVIPNSNSESWNPGPIYQTTYFIRCARSQGCVNYTAESNILAIKVVSCNGLIRQTKDVKSSSQIMIDGLTNDDMNTQNINQFEVSPNPTNSSFTIQLSNDNNQIGTIDLYDMSGRKFNKTIHFNTSESNLYPMDIEALPKGVYLLKVQYDNGEFDIEKVIKL